MVASSSGSIATSGRASPRSPRTAANPSVPSGGVPRATIVGTPRSGSTPARRSARSSSATSTFASLSRRPYSSSDALHHALSGTTTAPVAAAPKKATDHTGRMRKARGEQKDGEKEEGEERRRKR